MEGLYNQVGKITSKSGNRVNILKNAAINWDNVAVYDEDGNKLENVTDTSKLLSFDTKSRKVIYA